MNYLFPVTAIHSDGNTRVLDTVADVLAFVAACRTNRWHSPLVGIHWLQFGPLDWLRRPTSDIQNIWILRDDSGRPVDFNDFIEPRNNNWKKRHRNKRGNFIYRDGPVPGIYHSRAGYKQDAPRKRHGGKGVMVRAEMHRREFHELMGKPRIRRHYYVD